MLSPLTEAAAAPPEQQELEEEEEPDEGKSCLLLDAEFYATNPGPLAALARAASRALAESPSPDDGSGGSRSSWGRLPARYRVAGASSLAFVVCNMDKVRRIWEKGLIWGSRERREREGETSRCFSPENL